MPSCPNFCWYCARCAYPRPGRVDPSGLLRTKMAYPSVTVTNLSTNRAQQWLTLWLMQSRMLPTKPNSHVVLCSRTRRKTCKPGSVLCHGSASDQCDRYEWSSAVDLSSPISAHLHVHTYNRIDVIIVWLSMPFTINWRFWTYVLLVIFSQYTTS